MYDNKFQIILKRLREENGFRSQQSFATAFNVAQSTVGGWESGAREPNFETLLRLADFFNVSTDYLLGRRESVWHDSVYEDYRNASVEGRIKLLRNNGVPDFVGYEHLLSGANHTTSSQFTLSKAEQNLLNTYRIANDQQKAALDLVALGIFNTFSSDSLSSQSSHAGQTEKHA